MRYTSFLQIQWSRRCCYEDNGEVQELARWLAWLERLQKQVGSMYSVSQPSQRREQCWARSSLTVNSIQHKYQFLVIVLEQLLQANSQSIETVHPIILLESLQLSGSLDATDEDFGQ